MDTLAKVHGSPESRDIPPLNAVSSRGIANGNDGRSRCGNSQPQAQAPRFSDDVAAACLSSWPAPPS